MSWWEGKMKKGKRKKEITQSDQELLEIQKEWSFMAREVQKQGDS